MAKKVNTAIIGGFVITAIGLLLSSILIFGSGTFFKKRYRFVLFFDDNVSGLSTGAPVKFRGVDIGSVKSISLWADADLRRIDIPIVIEVDPQKFTVTGTGKPQMDGSVGGLIEQGLRAKLDIQSFVTGQYYIQLDFLPDTEAKLRGIKTEYSEIPTVKSSFTILSETFRDLPLEQIVEDIGEITGRIKTAMEKESLEKMVLDVREVLENMNVLVIDAGDLVANLDIQTQAIGGEVTDFLDGIADDLQGIAGQIDSLLAGITSEVNLVSTEMRGTLSSAQRTLDSAGKTFETADRLMGDSEVRHKLNKALDEMRAAARSIRELGDYLERHPESLITGKQSSR